MLYDITEAELQALQVFRGLIDRLAVGEGVEHARFAPSRPQYDRSMTNTSAKISKKQLKPSKKEMRNTAVNTLCSFLGNDFRLFVNP